MSIYVIGDQDTVLGFRLVGAQGKVVESVDQAREELNRLLKDREARLLLITREWAAEMRDQVNHLKITSLQPIVLEIPGKEPESLAEPLRDLVRRAVGIKV